VTIPSALKTDLTFSSALRNASLDQAGKEGFRVDILDARGQTVATQSFHPTTNAWVTYSMPVSFPEGGQYTIRMTELGGDDSLGAIIDNVEMLVCFTAGTLIDTGSGARAVETLRPGDPVRTLDAGVQPLRWIGQRLVGVAEQIADANLRPIVFSPGSLGPGLPRRPMALSPQHRLCLGGGLIDLHFGHPEVLVPARALVNGTTIRRAAPVAAVRYVHFLLDGHQIVCAEGVPSESFFPNALSMRGLDRAARRELLRLFPDLDGMVRAYPATARPVLRMAEGRLAARLLCEGVVAPDAAAAGVIRPGLAA
jgi:hypothetical protein